MEVLKEFLEYLPDTGAFLWIKKAGNRSHVGEVAGSLDKDGYVILRLKRKAYKAHRAAFFFMGVPIPSKVDHANGDPSDNSWSNLRDGSGSLNAYNQKLQKHNTSGVKGVDLHSSGKWQARVTLNGRRLYLGLHDTLEEATAIVRTTREKLHKEYKNDG